MYCHKIAVEAITGMEHACQKNGIFLDQASHLFLDMLECMIRPNQADQDLSQESYSHCGCLVVPTQSTDIDHQYNRVHLCLFSFFMRKHLSDV